MSTKKVIPIIDLFAGPGGLGEGFSSVKDGNQYCFDIKLSIEKDATAHKTLKLRSFYRQFLHRGEKIPDEYYELLRESDLKEREKKLKNLYVAYPEEAVIAAAEAQNIELGSEEYPSDIVDELITLALPQGCDDWVLIGGPPCQAYSLVGRSRVGGIHESDHRVYLYKEYLRIIAKHHPSVFVMENVKGLLSAKVNGEKVFDWILRDLSNPSSVFDEYDSPRYKIYSLVKEEVVNDRDFLIRSENYGIPQRRHRVILLGVREDKGSKPATLKVTSKKTTVASVIDKLPAIRSGLNRAFISSEIRDGKKRRLYENLEDSNMLWKRTIAGFLNEVKEWKLFANQELESGADALANGVGAEFITCSDTIDSDNLLHDWFFDPELGGVINHESRTHLLQDLKRYLFASIYTQNFKKFPRLADYEKYSSELMPDHENARSGKFADRFRVQLPDEPATTVTSHISKDGHYFIHYDPYQCRSLTVREAARIQTFPDNYLFCGTRTQQYHQVGNAVPPFLAKQIGEIVRELLFESGGENSSMEDRKEVIKVGNNIPIPF